MAANFRAQHDRDDDEIRSLRAKLEAQKTTFRWFHDTAYCFDYSLFPMVAGVGLEPTQRERRGILNPFVSTDSTIRPWKKVEARSESN